MKDPTLCSSKSSSKSSTWRSIHKATLPRGGVIAEVTGLGHQWWRFVDMRTKRCRHYHQALSCRFWCRRRPHPRHHPRVELDPSGLWLSASPQPAATVPALVCLANSRHYCSSSKQGNLNLMFPPVLEGGCRYLLSIAACGVCCILHGSRDHTGCGRPSAVQTSGQYTIPCTRMSWIFLR